MIELNEELYDGFMSNVEITAGKCWLWQGALVGDGYGSISVEGTKYRAHRVAVTLFLDPNYDPIGRGIDGDYVIHDCDTPPCVSPLCVKPSTASQNHIDAFIRGRIDPKKISDALKGRVFTKEHRAKLRKARKGMKFSVSHRRNLSMSHTGLKASAETKTKMSISAKKDWKRRKRRVLDTA